LNRNDKWSKYLDKTSTEYETTKDGWYAFLSLGDNIADIHLDTSKEIINKPCARIKQWQKDNYPKHFINFKIIKELEDKFEEAQKPWEKLYDRLRKAKKDYYDAVKTAHACADTARSAESNPKYNEEQRLKLNDKLDNSVKDEDREKRKYEEVIKEMDLYKTRYIENMTEVFNEAQQIEKDRMIFFKEIFESCHQILQTHKDERFQKVFLYYLECIKKMDSNADVEWWSNNFGVGTKPTWPEFENYTK
jgi:hypothetical protein